MEWEKREGLSGELGSITVAFSLGNEGKNQKRFGEKKGIRYEQRAVVRQKTQTWTSVRKSLCLLLHLYAYLTGNVQIQMHTTWHQRCTLGGLKPLLLCQFLILLLCFSLSFFVKATKHLLFLSSAPIGSNLQLCIECGLISLCRLSD